MCCIHTKNKYFQNLTELISELLYDTVVLLHGHLKIKLIHVKGGEGSCMESFSVDSRPFKSNEFRIYSVVQILVPFIQRMEHKYENSCITN
jgi:hypothetical protein